MKQKTHSLQTNHTLRASLPLAKKQPIINLRPFLFTALGLIFGILLYLRIRFGSLKASDFLIFAFLLIASLRPLSRKRVAAVFLCFFLFAGAGAGLIHLYTENYTSGKPAGEYEISGTVISFSTDGETSSLVLGGVRLDGEKAGGRLTCAVPSHTLRTGDVVSFRGALRRMEPGSVYEENLFVKNIRYLASTEEEVRVTGKGNALLRLNARVYDTLQLHLDTTQAATAYALLTGNPGSMDDSFTTAIRQGGIAHIFAVSGLHIGILYGAVSFAFYKLRRYKTLPATAIVFVYSAFCGFTVSSLRAAVMCTVMGLYGALGRKYDFLHSIAFACTAILLVRPAEWLSAGFRLSFASCLGLALFYTPLRRKSTWMPALWQNYLPASISVQLFTLPVMMETFGYFSLWGVLLNLLFVPLMPVLFLGLFLSLIPALLIPSAAGVFLSVPNGLLSLFALIFSIDFSLVLTGFSLGAGGTVYLAGAILLSERVNLKEKVRLFAAILSSCLFLCAIVLENAVFSGCKLIAERGAVLVESRDERILILDGSRSGESYESFLMRRYDGELTAVVLLNADENKALSSALRLPAKELRAYAPFDTGLTERELLTGESFTYGGLTFRYENGGKLTLLAEGKAVEIDFSHGEALGADLFLSGKEAGVYYLKGGAFYRFR